MQSIIVGKVLKIALIILYYKTLYSLKVNITDLKLLSITKTRPCNIQRFFTAKKNDNFQLNCFEYFIEAVLTSTHNIQIMYTPVNPSFTIIIKVGCKGV